MKKLITMILICLTLVCALAVSVSAAECEHTYFWMVKPGVEGFFGEMSAIAECTECGATTTDTIPAIFISLGYSSSEDGISQSYAINRNALAKYEELSREKLDFGVVVASRNVVGLSNPLDENGAPISEKVKTVSLTETSYDIVDVVIRGIPEEHKRSAELIFAMYIKAGNRITYLDNGVEKEFCSSRSYNTVVSGPDAEEHIDEDIMIANGVRYNRMSIEDYDLRQHQYWSGATLKGPDSSGTGKNFYALGNDLDREELPLGSIIYIESGWNYRPDARIDKTSANPRPDTVTKRYTVVTPEWWKSYTHRGFNVSNGKSAASITAEQIYEVFKIYIPQEAVYEYVKISNEEFLGLTREAYWDSTKAETYYDLRTNDANSPKFFATRKFAKAELEVGMYIKLKEGWTFRPEGWTNGQKNSSRPATSTKEITYITDAWWGSFTERAFNITPNENVSGYTFEDVVDAFEIYKPVLIER